MRLLDEMKKLLARSPKMASGDAVDLQSHIQQAYRLLRDANIRGLPVPDEVADAIIAARNTKDGSLPPETEARFWHAYGQLSSNIRPADRARSNYRIVFYLVLLVLLFLQFFYLSGDYVRAKLTDLDKQIVDTRGRAADQATTTPQEKVAADERIKQIQDSRAAYSQLVRSVVGIVGFPLDLVLKPFGLRGFFSTENLDDNESANIVIRSKLEMLLVFMSGYVLPILYGLLGACAFVLRNLSKEIESLSYTNTTYSLRLSIGMLSGLAVGWFIKPSVGDATLVSLSPLALAFVAGYGSDLFFVALDKIVSAFTPEKESRNDRTRKLSSGRTDKSTEHRHERLQGTSGETAPPEAKLAEISSGASATR